MKRFLNAWRFLSTVKIPGGSQYPAVDDLGDSVTFFPVVGLIFGLILACFWYILSDIINVRLANLFSVLLLVILSGALHLDGLADTFDGICGGMDKESIIRIMKDARIGAMGAVAIFFNLFVKMEALDNLSVDMMPMVLILLPITGRSSMVAAIYFSTYAKSEGLGKIFSDRVTRKDFIFSSIFLFILMFLLLEIGGLLIFLLLSLLTYSYISYFKKKLGGMTGDVFGACNELTETAFAIMASIIWEA